MIRAHISGPRGSSTFQRPPRRTIWKICGHTYVKPTPVSPHEVHVELRSIAGPHSRAEGSHLIGSARRGASRSASLNSSTVVEAAPAPCRRRGDGENEVTHGVLRQSAPPPPRHPIFRLVPTHLRYYGEEIVRKRGQAYLTQDKRCCGGARDLLPIGRPAGRSPSRRASRTPRSHPAGLVAQRARGTSTRFAIATGRSYISGPPVTHPPRSLPATCSPIGGPGRRRTRSSSSPRITVNSRLWQRAQQVQACDSHLPSPPPRSMGRANITTSGTRRNRGCPPERMPPRR